MSTITIPRELNTAQDLVAVPRRTYEEFLVWQKKIKSAKTFRPTVSEKKLLARARKEFTQGKFVTLAKLKYELGIDR